MGTIGYYICVPFAWLVRTFYTLTGSYGVALILFTLVIKLLLLPIQMKAKKSMLHMNRVSDHIKELQKRYAKNREKLEEELQKFYKEENINPFGGCLWSLLPLPIVIALYSIIRQPITHFMMLPESTVEELIAAAAARGADLSAIVRMEEGAAVVTNGVTQLTGYGQINLVKLVQEMNLPVPEGWYAMDYTFLGLDLTITPQTLFSSFRFEWAVIGILLIPILSGLSQMLSTLLMLRTEKNGGGAAMEATNKSMMLMMPLMSVYIAFITPAALGVYWIAQSVFSYVQDALITKKYVARIEAEEEARYQARQQERQKRVEEALALQEQREEQSKPTLREKQQAARAAKEAKAAKAASSTTEAGRVGDRPYARGRSYQPDRYDETK